MTNASPNNDSQCTPFQATGRPPRNGRVDRGTGRILTDGGDNNGDGENDGDGADEEEATDGNGEETQDEPDATDEEEADEDGSDERHEESGGEGTTVLFLDLEGLFLNLLGLEVDLNEVVLDVSAVPGEGRLLGNLLSAVGGLLDSPADVLGGLLPDDLGSFLDEMAGGEGEGEGSSPVSEAAGSAKSALGDAADEIPMDELMSQIAAEFVRQLLGGSTDDQGGEETAEASG